MTSVVIIADSGAEMARLTATVDAAPGMVLVRHASGRAPVASIVADHQPTLVVLGRDVAAAPRARAAGRDPRASPDSRIVVVAEDAGARRLGSALAAGATAVIPGGPSAEALGTVLGGPRRRHGRRGAHAAGRVTRGMSGSSHTPRKDFEMRVLIVVDNALTAEAIRREMRHAPTCQVIGYVNGRRPCAMAIADAAPDLVVIDDAGEASTLQRIREVRSTVPAAKVVLLTARMDDERLEEALAAGIDSAISKAAPPTERRAPDPGGRRRQCVPRVRAPDGQQPVSSFLPNLTAQELEILRWVAAGASNSAIARELFVTEQTVKFHLSNVYRKLGVSNRTEASHYAHVHGLIDATQAQPMRTRCGPCRPRRDPAHKITEGRKSMRNESPTRIAVLERPTSSAGVLQGRFRRSTSLDESDECRRRVARAIARASRATVRRCATSTSSTPTTCTATSPASSRTSTRPRTSPRWCSRSR